MHAKDGGKTVAVLGLGIIGSIWARKWNEDGVLRATWNRTPHPDFPCWVDSPAKCAEAADVLMIVVADPPAVESVLNSLLPSLSKRHLIIQSSTIDPESSARFAAMVEAKGARYLEAPFTGSTPGAETRETVFYLGGEDAVIEEAEPLLKLIARTTRMHIGTGPQACALKLSMNLQLAIQLEALCESLSLVRSAGVKDDVYFQALERNMAYSPLVKGKSALLRKENYSPQFSVKHMHKDMRLAVKAAEGHTKAPLTQAVEARLRATELAGLGDEDYLALYKTLNGAQ